MTKVDIFSGFLGAGKTTLIKKLINEAYSGQKIVLIENEFGDVGIDGGFMAEAGIQVSEMNSGCICCSLVGDFSKALQQVVAEFAPDRILIEPSGVGKLSDIIRAVSAIEGLEVNAAAAVADANKCRMYMKNFGEFYADQISHAGAVVLSRTAGISPEKLEKAIAVIRGCNADAVIITTPWDELEGSAILAAIEGGDSLAHELEKLKKEHEHEHHHEHHHHECDDPDCSCHEHEHHHEHRHHECDDPDCSCHEHEHHHEHHHHECDDPDCSCHEHEHHHEHHHHECDDPDCSCHEHEHHHHECDDPNCSCHHHGHAADEVFTSWGIETAKKFSKDELEKILEALDDEHKYGFVLRAKGIVDSGEGWLHFDHVPGEADIRRGAAAVTGRLCVIGSRMNTGALKELFGV